MPPSATDCPEAFHETNYIKHFHFFQGNLKKMSNFYKFFLNSSGFLLT